MISIACDFGGTNIKIGILKDGKVVRKSSIEAFSHMGIEYQLKNVEVEIKKLLQDSNYELQDCSGIGIAIPGLVDNKEKRVLSINEKYKDAETFEFKEWAEVKLGLPLVMDNDANLALLGETKAGCAKGSEDAVLMILGTGIGTAAVINGKLLRGKHYQAGCLGGHFITKVNGKKCTCGSIGCIEAQIGSWAIPDEAASFKEFPGSMLAKCELIDVKNVILCMDKGDTFASAFFNHLIDNWSAAVVNLIHAYDPEVIILSGGIMKAGNKILKPLSEKVWQMAWTPWGKVQFLLAEDPDTSVLLGIEYLLKEAILNENAQL